jgi:capsid protein
MLDRMGAPSKFRVLAGQTFQDFEAKDVIPLYDPRRCDQHRGLTGFIHALNDIQDRGEIIALEKTGVKVSLTPSLVLYSDSGDDLLSSSQVTSDDQVYEQFQAGQIVKRSATDKLESFQSNRPTTGLKDFDDLLLRKICAGHGIPFEFIFSPTALSGPAARLVMAQASRTFERRQKLIIDKLLQRLWGWIISRAILRGDLAPMPFLEAQRVRWQGPSKISIDVGRDAKANLDDLRAGLRTWAEDYSERGQDWQEALKQKAREAAYIKQLAEEYGVTVDQIAMLTPNPIQPILPA